MKTNSLRLGGTCAAVGIFLLPISTGMMETPPYKAVSISTRTGSFSSWMRSTLPFVPPSHFGPTIANRTVVLSSV